MRHLAPVALAVWLAGCAAPVDPTRVGPDARPSAAAVAALADSLGAARSSAARRAVAARVLARSGVTPLADYGRQTEARFEFGPPAARVVSGYVPGAHPVVRTDRVLLGAALDGPGAAAVLEVARVLAERSRWANVPDRAVHVVLWEGRRTARQSLAQTLRAPLWSREATTGAVVVGEGPAAVDGVPVAAVGPGGGAALADSVLARVLDAVRYRPPVDTTAAR